jgi:hypothetical protein
VSIGGALAEARSEAGLSITDVSERTRIRSAIIRDIERDDYAACGGDFYARGHIRAIAKVIGTDPVPLIAEYDAARMPDDDHDDRVDGLLLAPDAPGAADPVHASRPDPKGGSETEPIPPVAEFSLDQMLTSAPVHARSPYAGQVARTRLAASARAGAARLGAAADGAADRLAARSERTRGRTPDRFGRSGAPRPRLTVALALALLAAIGLLLYLLISGSSGPSSAASHHSGVAALRHRSPAGKRDSGSAPPSAGASRAATQPVSVLLTPATIRAFGPGGPGQGDDAQRAALAIDGNSRTAWHSSWYTTADFGRLQSGTGLLLDMGQSVTVSSASVLFGPAPGGAFQIRAGNSPALASLQPVAQAADPGGAVTVHVSRPVRARYLLVWLTRLPPDSSGTFEAYIYNIAVRGTR